MSYVVSQMRSLAAALWMLSLCLMGQPAGPSSPNVFLITTDGLRWEELFGGIDPAMLDADLNKASGNTVNIDRLKKDFWRETPSDRRTALFPFLWSIAAKKGQLWGNRELDSHVRVANGFNFSYPGYNEFLTGVADPKIDSNDKNLNSHTNVIEWLNTRPGFEGRAAAAINWDTLPWILNAPRAGFPVWSAFAVPEGTKALPVPPVLDATARRGQTLWDSVTLDSFVGSASLHAVQTLKPRAMYISYGETDDWAHEGNYERYIRSAHAFDAFLGELWDLAQSIPQYRDQTTFVITTDHGRCPAPVAWKGHGRNVPGSPYTWIVVLGPDTLALGERRNTPPVTAGQVAATVAAAVGEDFTSAMGGRVAPPIPGAFR